MAGIQRQVAQQDDGRPHTGHFAGVSDRLVAYMCGCAIRTHAREVGICKALYQVWGVVTSCSDVYMCSNCVEVGSCWETQHV
jgi:hypothetical protein